MNGQFFGTKIASSTFLHTNLKYSVFKSAELTNIDFSDTNLYAADFRGAVLIRSKLQSALTIQDATLPSGTLGDDLNMINKDHVRCNLSQQNLWIVENGNVTRSPCSQDHRHCQFALPAFTTSASMTQRISLADNWNVSLWPRSQVVLRANMISNVLIEWKQISSTGQVLFEQRLGNLQH